MYEDPEWYSAQSDDHKRESKWAMELYWNRLNWRPGEKVLDVGCGSGDVLHDVIRPALPRDLSRLVGVDWSPSMIDFAKSKWKDTDITFEVMDISTHKDPLLFFDNDIQDSGGFNKIFSFFCLQWVKDRRRMVENLYRLLQPGGYAYLLLVVRSGVYNVWDKLASHEKWKPYLKDIRTPMNEYIYMDNYDEVFCESAKESGFEVLDYQVVERKDAFLTRTDSDEEKISRLRTVDPFLRLIPENRKREYLQELLENVKRDVSPRGAPDYTALVVVLKKD